MCGIAGILLSQPGVPEISALRAMADAMRFRGPDDEGHYVAPHIGLVHLRLSIRDLSQAGHCPMASADGTLQVVFNGEIYNWRELRRELESKGYDFVSQTDTEVLLHGYHAWGESLVDRLRGMFAFAIWNQTDQTLWLGRDRAGEKPLFYAASETAFVFASNPAALLPLGMQGEIDPVGIACHLVHSFIPASHTAWASVRSLPPAHTLRLKPGELPTINRYWDFPRSGPVAKRWTRCVTDVEAALDDSVVRSLDADVPVGVFLSGGVDSSLIAALAARHRPGIKAYSLGFAEAPYSELNYAVRVARHVGLKHRAITIGVEDVIDCLPHLVEQYGQPFGDASSVPTYLVSCLARKEVKVVLSGDGGDELFGGYWRMQSGVYAARYAAVVPRLIREAVVPRLAAHMGGVGQRWAAMNDLSLAQPGAGYTNAESWYGRLADAAGPALDSVKKIDLASLRTGRTILRAESSVVQRLLYDDFQVQLPDAYLTKVDVASMAASLEVRSPFLDPDLMELGWSLPDRTKLRWGRRKVLLKQIAARHVPADVVYRPKMGFGMPLKEWFRAGLGEYAASLFSESRAVETGYLRPRVFQQTLDTHHRNGSEATRLWLLLWLELWCRWSAAPHPAARTGRGNNTAANHNELAAVGAALWQ